MLRVHAWSMCAILFCGSQLNAKFLEVDLQPLETGTAASYSKTIQTADGGRVTIQSDVRNFRGSYPVMYHAVEGDFDSSPPRLSQTISHLSSNVDGYSLGGLGGARAFFMLP